MAKTIFTAVVSCNKEEITSFITSSIKKESDAGLMAPHAPEEITKMITDGDAILGIRDDLVIAFSGILHWRAYVEIAALWVHPDCRGKGIATEVIAELCNLCANKYPDKSVIALGNDVSSKIFLKACFTEVDKTSLETELWEACKGCKEEHIFPQCHCRGMVAPK